MHKVHFFHPDTEERLTYTSNEEEKKSAISG